MNTYKKSLARTLLQPILRLGLGVSILASLANVSLAAAIYKTVDENGNVVFSDQPDKEAEKIEVQAPVIFDSSVMTSPYGNASNETNPETDSADFKYTRLEITSPANETAIRDNTGNFELSYSVEPRVHPEHTVQLMMDGQVHTKVSQSGTIQFENLDRGTHVFQLRVIQNSNKKVLEKGPASAVSILRYASQPRPTPHRR